MRENDEPGRRHRAGEGGACDGEPPLVPGFRYGGAVKLCEGAPGALERFPQERPLAGAGLAGHEQPVAGAGGGLQERGELGPLGRLGPAASIPAAAVRLGTACPGQPARRR